ncbi:MAG: AMP-binding protein [Planctomycetes bacterium]|nr:AMP-binding protein [Planctomycetota bacterium]
MTGPHSEGDTAIRDLAALVEHASAPGGGFELCAGGLRCSGAEFAARVRAAAAGLRSLGLSTGDRVAVLLPRCVEEAVAICAAAVAGGIAVPIHGKLKDDQVAHILADAAPFAVVTSSVRLLALRDPGAVLAGHRILRVDDGALPVASTAFADLAGDAAALPRPTPRDPAVLLYTSGSTGLPKGIVQDHHNLCLGAAVVANYLRLTAADHLLALLPFSFDYGLNQLLSALHAGCRVTAADPLGAGELHELLRTVRPSGIAGVPSLWHQVAASLTSGTLTAEDGASLRYVTNSGGALRTSDSAVLRRCWPHVEVYAMYGLTEAFRSAFLPPAEFDAHPDSFGRAIAGVELLLVDPGSGAVLEGPATGELVHAGTMVAQGYWRRPDATAERFRADPRGGPGTVVYSGDLVRRDAAGRHFFVARRDRLLKVHGHRVSPDEVAAAVAGCPGVGEVAVLGVPAGAEGHRIVLCVSGDPADGDLRRQVVARCRTRLPSFMQPAEVVVLSALPHNSNGKVDEAALRANLRSCTDDTSTSC